MNPTDNKDITLELEGGNLFFRVAGYSPSPADEWDQHWAYVECKLQGSRISIDESGESLLCVEVENLRDAIERALRKHWPLAKEDRQPETLEFIEPHFIFVFYPPLHTVEDLGYEWSASGHEIQDVYAEWTIILWDGGPTDVSVVVQLGREELEAMLAYLKQITSSESN